jgi:uncharacterized protein (TIGR03435 family)
METAVFLLIAVVGASVAFAQSSVKFEVASVKPAVHDNDAPAFQRGGPGTSEAERIGYERQNLVRLLYAAYGLQADQVYGPSWIGSELYTVVAKVPPGTTQEQVKLMWQDLLAERFHLKVHIIKKDFPAYELSVAKGGPRFRVGPGFPEPFQGQKWGRATAPPRNVRQTFRDCSMTEFIEQLRWPLGTEVRSSGFALGRVVDKTGLSGRYDFTLEFAGRYAGGAFPPPLPEGQIDTAPTLIDALRQQLGLTLIEKKASLDVLVVDHVDKVPTEN